MKLAPLLYPEAMSVYSATEAEDCKLYDKVKEALYTHYRISLLRIPVR